MTIERAPSGAHASNSGFRRCHDLYCPDRVPLAHVGLAACDLGGHPNRAGPRFRKSFVKRISPPERSLLRP